MPLKVRRDGATLPAKFNTVNSAWSHFLATSYEPPDNPLDTIEVRHAFFAGAIYLRGLVQAAAKLPADQVKSFMATLYQELDDERAKNAAKPWFADLPAPDPFQAIIIEPAPQGAPTMETAPTPPPPAPAPAPAPAPQPTPPAPAPAPPPAPAAVPPQEPPATTTKPMQWNAAMVGEFQAAYQGAKEAGTQTFPFHGHTFRTMDAPNILGHLATVFKNG